LPEIPNRTRKHGGANWTCDGEESALMPIDRFFRPVAQRDLCRSAAEGCGAGASFTGGCTQSENCPIFFAQAAMKSVRLAGAIPALLRLLAGIELDETIRAARSGNRFPWLTFAPRTVDRMDGVEERDGFFCLVGLQRPDQMQGRCRGSRTLTLPLRPGFLTRFSPNTRCPASITAQWPASKVLDNRDQRHRRRRSRRVHCRRGRCRTPTKQRVW